MSEHRGDKLLRLREVEALVGLGHSTIYRLMNAGEFPTAIRRTPGTVGWWESEVLDWAENRPRVVRASIRASKD